MAENETNLHQQQQHQEQQQQQDNIQQQQQQQQQQEDNIHFQELAYGVLQANRSDVNTTNNPQCGIAVNTALRDVTPIQNLNLSIGHFTQYVGSENVNVGCTTNYINQAEDDGSELSPEEEITADIKQLLSFEKECFVEIRAYFAVMDNLRSGRHTVITGFSGDGKTTICRKAVGKFVDEQQKSGIVWKPFIISNTSEFKDVLITLKRYQCLVFIDNIFGISNYSRTKFEDWCTEFEKLDIRRSKFLLLISMRTHMYNECQNKLTKMKPLDESCTINLIQGYELTQKEKYEMLKKHIHSSTFCEIVTDAEKSSSLQLTQHEIKEIVRSTGTLGFPICCKLFARDENIFKKGKKFFEKPIEYLTHEISYLKEDEKDKYATLLYILLSPGRKIDMDVLKKEIFDNSSENLKNILKILSNVTGVKIYGKTVIDAAEKMNGHLITKNSDNSFSFAHESILDTVCLSFGKDFPEQVLRICDNNFLCEYIRTEACVLSTENPIVLEERKLKVLVERIVEEIENGNFFDLCHHVIFTDSLFIQTFFNFIEDKQKSFTVIQKILHKGSEFFKMALTTFPAKSGFVKEILKNDKFKQDLANIFKSLDFFDVLVTICARGENEIYELLLKLGAQVHPACLAAASLAGNVQLMDDLIRNHGLKADSQGVKWKGKELIPLMEAVRSKNVEALNLLFRNNADVNITNKEDRTPLHKAVLENHDSGLRRLLNEAVDPNTRDMDGKSPLIYAVEHNFEECVKVLVERKASVNLADRSKQTPLHLATNNINITCILLENGAVINQRNKRDQSPLHVAVTFGNEDTARDLLSRSAVLDFQDFQGNQPLHLAAIYRNISCLQMLLAYGANVNSANGDGQTVLHIAVSNNDSKTLRHALINGGRINKTDLSGLSPLHIAVGENLPEITEVLLKANADVNCIDINGSTPLLLAAEKGHEHMIQHLIASGGSVELVNNNNESALHKAVDNGHIEAVEMLLDKGFSEYVNESNSEGLSPLHVGCIRNYADITECLLDVEGVDVNVREKFGRTPLSFSAETNSTYLCRKLLQKGADITISDEIGQLPIHYAVKKGHLPVVKLLLADKSYMKEYMRKELLNLSVENRKYDVLEYLLHLFPEVLNTFIDGKQTLLHLVCRENLSKAVGILLKNKAVVSVLDSESNTPLHLSSERCDVEISKCLLENGASVNAQNKYGQTPLIMAASNWHCELSIIQCLVDFEANLKLDDCQGNTLFHYGCAFSNHDICRYIIYTCPSIVLKHNHDKRTGLHLGCLVGFPFVVELIIDYIDNDQNVLTDLESLIIECINLCIQGRKGQLDWHELPDISGKMVLFADIRSYEKIAKLLDICYRISYYNKKRLY